MRIFARVAVVFAAVFAVSGYGSSAPVTQDRILGPVDATQVARVPGTANPRARVQYDQGRTDTSRMISGAITFRLSAAQQAELDRLLREQQDPKSPNYHRWISPDQYATRFGMSSNDLAKVTSWLQSQGLHVDSISRNRNEISFSGSVGQVEYAFKTEIHNYTIRGEQHFANAMDVSLPAAFSQQVLSVRGLDSFAPKPRVHPVKPQFTSNITGNHFVIPGDFATIYRVNLLYSQGFDGAGQSIAVIGQTNITLSDVDAFRTASGLPKFDPTLLLVPNTGSGLTCSSTGDTGEADLDVEWSGAIAKSANIIYVYAGVGTGGTCSNRTKNVFDALNYAITNNIAPVISISYGNCEANLSGFVQTARQWAQQANAQGQTISGPSGDQGAADCESATATAAIHGLAVDVPAAIPEVTGVGGSEFTGDGTQCPGSPPSCPGGVSPADSPYWSGSSSPTSGASALGYIPETSWNDTTSSIQAGGGLAATGGGASTVFAKPSWQTGQGVPNDSKRDVPDISLNASSGHDPYLICSGGSCVNGFRDANNNLNAVGGTSAGAPTFAAILAIINQATQSSGQTNVNPTLYSMAASTPSAFHDITSGNNKVPCTSGTPNCPSGTASIGFSASTGYDQVTGLGTIDAFNLVTSWPGFSSAQRFAVGASPTNVSIASAGQSGTATVVVAGVNGFSGTVSLTCSLSSSTSGLACSLSPASVNLDTANTTQTATVTIGTTAAAGLFTRHHSDFYFALLLFPGTLLFGVPRRDKRARLLSVVALLIGIGAIASCGGGTSSTQKKTQGTPAGSYTMTVTATSGSTTHTTTVNLTVQ